MPLQTPPVDGRQALSYSNTQELQAAIAQDPGLQAGAGEREVIINHRHRYHVSYDTRTVTAAPPTGDAARAGEGRPAPTAEQMQRIFFPAQPLAAAAGRAPAPAPAPTPVPAPAIPSATAPDVTDELLTLWSVSRRRFNERFGRTQTGTPGQSAGVQQPVQPQPVQPQPERTPRPPVSHIPGQGLAPDPLPQAGAPGQPAGVQQPTQPQPGALPRVIHIPRRGLASDPLPQTGTPGRAAEVQQPTQPRPRPRPGEPRLYVPVTNRHNITSLRNWSNMCYANSSLVALARTWQQQGRLAEMRAGLSRDARVALIQRLNSDPALTHVVPSLFLYGEEGENAFHNPNFMPQARNMIDAHMMLAQRTADLFEAVNAQGSVAPVEAQKAFWQALYNYGKTTGHSRIQNIFEGAVDTHGRVVLTQLQQQDAAEFMQFLHEIFGYSTHPDTSVSVRQQEQLMESARMNGRLTATTSRGAMQESSTETAIITIPTSGRSLRNTLAHYGEMTDRLDSGRAAQLWPLETQNLRHTGQQAMVRTKESLFYKGDRPPRQVIVQSQLWGDRTEAGRRQLGLGESRYYTPENSYVLLDGIELNHLDRSTRVSVPMRAEGSDELVQVPYRLQSVVLRGGATEEAGTFKTLDLTGARPMMRYDEQVETFSEFLATEQLEADTTLAGACLVKELAPYLFVLTRIEDETTPARPRRDPQPDPRPVEPERPVIVHPTRPAPLPPGRTPPAQRTRALKLGDGTANVRAITATTPPPPIPRLQPNQGVAFPAITLLGAGSTSQFSDIYDPAGHPGRGDMVSVNAGDEGRYVGGGTINAAFGRALFGSSNQDSNPFAAYHRSIERLAPDARGFIEPNLEPATPITGVIRSLCRPAKDVDAMHLHIFGDDYCPNGNTQNRAMLYIVPPNGRKIGSRMQFLVQVRETATAIVELVHEYNRRASARGEPTLERLRICRFSSGSYSHGEATGDQVAAAIVEGLKNGVYSIEGQEGGVLLPEIEFEDGAPHLKLFSGCERVRVGPAVKRQ